MEYKELLEMIINEGIEAAKADYTKPEDADKLEGSINGFEACRGKRIAELEAILLLARVDTHKQLIKAHDDGLAKDYWRARCFELEVEWTCNVLSVVFMINGIEPIIPPTVRGAFKAQQIFGNADWSLEKDVWLKGIPSVD